MDSEKMRELEQVVEILLADGTHIIAPSGSKIIMTQTEPHKFLVRIFKARKSAREILRRCIL